MKLCAFCSNRFESIVPERTHCSPECRLMTVAAEFNGVDGCWDWPKSRNVQTGYGQMSIWTGKKHQILGAHRVSFSAFNGPLQRGAVVRHSCDNRACFNPAHLLLGSQMENVQDMRDRGRERHRTPPGEEHHAAKATDEIVRAIRASDEPLSVLVERHGLSKSATWAIRAGRTWKHVQSSLDAMSSDEIL